MRPVFVHFFLRNPRPEKNVSRLPDLYMITKINLYFQAENKKKNRYPDKLPYDHNRVILNALVNATNSDYINASTGYSSPTIIFCLTIIN
mgnify:CR=1 FL=1